jgi:hypothetical protein
LTVRSPLTVSRRHLQISGTRRVREISETEVKTSGGKVEIVIEGKIKESDRRQRLLSLPVAGSGCEAQEICHPLCRLQFVHEIKHTGDH